MFVFNSGHMLYAWGAELMFVCISRQSSSDPLMKGRSDVLQILQLWREKVFTLCVQLRSKDIEMRREKDRLLSEVWKQSSELRPLNWMRRGWAKLMCVFQARSVEQQLQQEQHRTNVLQHSLHDRMAELDLEKVEKEVRTKTTDGIYSVFDDM